MINVGGFKAAIYCDFASSCFNSSLADLEEMHWNTCDSQVSNSVVKVIQ